MIKIIPAAQRHFQDFGWLATHWLFSFDTYYDPDNLQFGSLRVFNDDVVQAGGFPPHPHAEMEIITIVLSGEVTHSDSMGNKTIIRSGDVQRMTAGTGIRHSEFNFGDEPLHLYQIWITPDRPRQTPSYDQKTIPLASLKNRLWAVASSQDYPDAVHLNTDATIYLGDFDAGHAHEFRNQKVRRLFVYLTSGQLEINGTLLGAGDQARMEGESLLKTKAQEACRFIVIDIP
ncbi:MAG: pirin family protein [candidate division Zixibacteria bacterium]|nr:pirin family protein [candidate division Zixibacteria bacterium]